MQRRGIRRQVQRTSSGSTAHDRDTIPQISSSRSLSLDRPWQSAPRYPAVVANRRTTYRARRHPPLTRQPLHRRTTRRIGSIQISQLARGTQIPIAPAARPYVPLSAVSSLGGFRTPAAGLAAPSLKRPASETLHKSGNTHTQQRLSLYPPVVSTGRRNLKREMECALGRKGPISCGHESPKRRSLI